MDLSRQRSSWNKAKNLAINKKIWLEIVRNNRDPVIRTIAAYWLRSRQQRPNAN